jgi:hypothetical protein
MPKPFKRELNREAIRSQVPIATNMLLCEKQNKESCMTTHGDKRGLLQANNTIHTPSTNDLTSNKARLKCNVGGK